MPACRRMDHAKTAITRGHPCDHGAPDSPIRVGDDVSCFMAISLVWYIEVGSL